MSAHTHAADEHADDHAAEDHAGHDDHDDHGAEPIPPEPESPAWLPLLGGALFLLALLGFLFFHSDDAEVRPSIARAEPAQDVAPAAPATAPNAPAAPGSVNPRLRQLAPGMMAPRPAGTAGGPAAAPNRANPPTFGNPGRPYPGDRAQPNP